MYIMSNTVNVVLLQQVNLAVFKELEIVRML